MAFLGEERSPNVIHLRFVHRTLGRPALFFKRMVGEKIYGLLKHRKDWFKLKRKSFEPVHRL